jgi:Fur family transcriptional regulator, iron response regulator
MSAAIRQALRRFSFDNPPLRPLYVRWTNGIGKTMTVTQADRSTAWLARGGLRPTRQRVALAELLVGDGENRHVTAESLYAASVGSGEKVSLATVYNTLRAFCEAGLMQEVTVDGHRSYFDTRMDDHPHFYWEDRGELTDAPAEELKIMGLPAAPDGTEVSRVDVVIRLRRV